MFWAALAYAAGIVTGSYTWWPASWWMGAADAFLAAGLYFDFVRKRKLPGTALALGAFFLAGSLEIQLRSSSTHPDAALQPFAYGPAVEMTAHVTREGKVRQQTPGEVSQSLDVESEEIVTENGSHFLVHSGVRLGIYAQRRERDEPRRGG